MKNSKSNDQERLPRFSKGDYLFDGFAHRGYDETLDGWRNVTPEPSDYACVRQAEDVVRLFDDLSRARVRIWELEKELKLWKRLPT